MDQPLGESWLVVRHPDQRPPIPAPAPGQYGRWRAGRDIVAVLPDEASANAERAKLAAREPNPDIRYVVERQPHMRIIQGTRP